MLKNYFNTEHLKLAKVFPVGIDVFVCDLHWCSNVFASSILPNWSKGKGSFAFRGRKFFIVNFPFETFCYFSMDLVLGSPI